MPDNITLDDIRSAMRNPDEVDIEEIPLPLPKAAPTKEHPNGTFLKTTMQQDWVTGSAARFFAEGGMPLDLDFDLEKDVPEAEWKDITDGFDDETVMRLAENARSRSHLYFLADLAKESQQNEEILASYGGWGVAGRIGANVIDPSNYILAVSTGGLGVATKATRLSSALKLATTAEARREAMVAATTGLKSLTPNRAALLSGLGVGIEGAAIEALASQSDVTRDGWDVAYAGLTSAAFGAGLSRIFPPREISELRSQVHRSKLQLENDELLAEIGKRRAEIASRVGDVEGARAAEAELAGRVGMFLHTRDTDMAGYEGFAVALESGGKANAKAATSSATGLHQFTGSTWLGYVRKVKPQWAEGLDEAALLALRTDPAKSKEIFEAFTADNIAALRKAGAPVNQFTVYAAHHFGPGKGAVFAKADAATLMDDILTAGQLKANPYLKGLTKAEAIKLWSSRAKRSGVDVDALVGKIPENSAEASRNARVAAFDKASTEARLGELDSALAVGPGTGERMTSKQRRQMERERSQLESHLKGHRGSDLHRADAEAQGIRDQLTALTTTERTRRLDRLRAEDEAKLGPEVAASKARESLRKAHAKHLEGIDRANLERRLGEASKRSEGIRSSATTRLSEVIAALDNDTRLTERPALESEAGKLREALGLHERDTAAKAADDAERMDLAGLLGAAKDRGADLRKLDALDDVKTATDLRAYELEAGGAVKAFGPDTLSAARAVGFDPGLHPGLEGMEGGKPVAKMKLAGAVRMFGHGTFAGVLRGSDNPLVRELFGRFVGNSLGNVDDAVVDVGASEIAQAMQKSMVGKFNATINTAYRQWMKDNGVGLTKTYNRTVRGDFMRELGLHIRGVESDNAAVKAAASRVSAIFAEFLKEAKDAGVKGFDNVEADPNWLPRVFDFHAFHRLSDTVKPDQLTALISKAVQQAHPELEEKIANRIGKAYIDRMRNLRVGNDPGLLQGMSFDDIGFLRQFLGDAGLGSDEIEEVVGAFAAKKLDSGESGGSFRHAKKRQRLDENFSMELRNVKANDGSTVAVSVADLLENNVEVLFNRYARTMSGHIAMAKIGVKSKADFDLLIRRLEREMEGDLAELENVKRMATAAYDVITGRPLEDSSAWSELMRTGRDLAFASQMENAGLANVPDLAALLSWGNFRYTAKAFFGGDMFGSLWRRGTDGRMSDELLRELEETLGTGTDYLNNAVFASYDVADDYAKAMIDGNRAIRTLSEAASVFQHGTRIAGRAVSAGSGLAGVTSLAQRLAARNALFRLKDELFKGGKFSDGRMARLGIDPAMRERIEGQMRKHTAWTDGELGGKIQRIDFHKWDDLDARDALLYAVHREARKNVQEDDLGDTFLFQHKGIGKLLSQFRRFGVTAYTKQTLRGISEHDAETITRVLMQSTLAAGVYILRHELVAYGMEAAGVDSGKVDKYRADNLDPKHIGAAAIRNSGWAALAPDLYDSTAGYALGSPLFDVRNSGLKSSFLESVPAIAWGTGLGNAVAGTVQAVTRSDRQFTQQDAKAWQALIPFGNHLMVAPAIQALTAELPEKDEDEDSDSVEWFWQ